MIRGLGSRGAGVALASALVATALGCGGTPPAATTGPTARAPRTAAEITAAATPAIVRVEASDVRVGTGFVVDPAGVVATNLHVVAGIAAVRVKLVSGETLPVIRVRGLDLERDLVLLEVAASAPLPVLSLGDSTTVRAGDPVIAIGNPIGLDYTVSDGLVSSVRPIAPELTLLQISAPISVGSSGGPLFDVYGDVIGLTQAVLADGQNLNFAIPTAYLRELLAADQPPLSPMEFAQLTTLPATPERPQIVRNVPHHDAAVLDGCALPDAAGAVQAIDAAIQLGAPLYNAGNHEACLRIYENAARQLAQASPCAGIRTAFTDGLATAATRTTYTEQAWALRDTFDGIIEVVLRVHGSAPAPTTTP
ncbi:MAG: trypsin-like peptidase domain-containing protein [Kofleriaceae bacterium]